MLPFVMGRDGSPELVVGGEYPVVPMPVLPRRRDEIGEPVEELKRPEFDDAIGPRPRGLAAAAGPDPVGCFVPRQHVADAGDAAVCTTPYGESLEGEGVPVWRVRLLQPSIQRRPDLHSNLPVGDLAVFDMPPGFEHLKPSKAFLIDGSLGDGVLYCPFNASVRGSNQFDYLIGVFTHGLGSGDGWTAEILFGEGLGLGL